MSDWPGSFALPVSWLSSPIWAVGPGLCAWSLAFAKVSLDEPGGCFVGSCGGWDTVLLASLSGSREEEDAAPGPGFWSPWGVFWRVLPSTHSSVILEGT